MHGWICIRVRRLILPTHFHILSEKAEDCEQTRESSATPHFVQQLIAIHIFMVPGALPSHGLACLGKDLYHAVDDTIKTLVLIQEHAIPRDQSPGLQMPRKFMEDLIQSKV